MKQSNIEDFSSILRQLIESTGLNIYEISRATKISYQSIRNYCNNISRPNMEQLIKLADYFAVPIDYLVGRCGLEDGSIPQWDKEWGCEPYIDIGGEYYNMPMTNADKIRSMSDEELATHLYDIGWDCHLCAEHRRIENEPLMRLEKCDANCAEHCLEWLQQPAEQPKEDA